MFAKLEGWFGRETAIYFVLMLVTALPTVLLLSVLGWPFWARLMFYFVEGWMLSRLADHINRNM